MQAASHRGGPPRPARAASGLSLTEILLAVFVIGVSALPVLELIRSSTASLEVTEIESHARALAADVLERLSGQPMAAGAIVDRWANSVAGPDIAFDLLLKSDPSLATGFPTAELSPILSLHKVTLRLQIDRNVNHPALGGAQGLDRYRVTVGWNDARGQRREVTLATLVARK